MTRSAFCRKRDSDSHMCSKKYSYEYIFRRHFISTWLTFQPETVLDFYNYSLKEIEARGLFLDSPDPSDVMRGALHVFIEEYQCFV